MEGGGGGRVRGEGGGCKGGRLVGLGGRGGVKRRDRRIGQRLASMTLLLCGLNNA